MHVVCARTARESLVMSESGSIADLSQHTVMPYAERGWICVSGSHVCVYACCSARLRRPGCCILCIPWSSGGHGLPKSRFLLHKLFFRFLAYLAVQHVVCIPTVLPSADLGTYQRTLIDTTAAGGRVREPCLALTSKHNPGRPRRGFIPTTDLHIHTHRSLSLGLQGGGSSNSLDDFLI